MKQKFPIYKIDMYSSVPGEIIFDEPIKKFQEPCRIFPLQQHLGFKMPVRQNCYGTQQLLLNILKTFRSHLVRYIAWKIFLF